MTAKNDGAALLTAQDGEGPLSEVDELQSLLADARERGYLSFDEVTTALEEVEVTKEQVQELHAHLVEQGIDIVGADGKPVTSENGRLEEEAGRLLQASAA